MSELDATKIHILGLEASLTGRFSEAKDRFAEARRGFEDEGSNLDVGRVDRDMARVYAGLGKPALRDASVEKALEIHWSEYTTTDDSSAASELAATEHVRARVALAQMVEHHERHPDGAGGMWRMAYGLLKAEGGNQDYLEQVIAHGSLALATFGRVGELQLAKELVRDPVVDRIEDPKRQKAVRTAGQILMARNFFVPVHLVPQVRKKVIDAVAGPYLAI